MKNRAVSSIQGHNLKSGFEMQTTVQTMLTYKLCNSVQGLRLKKLCFQPQFSQP